MAADSVSVVIPARNGERYLGAAIESALGQTHRPLEVIVVDDGSTDATAGVAVSYPGVQLVSQPAAGPGAARNRGIALARGTYLGFLDADDVWVATKLERQLAAFRVDPTPDIVIGHVRQFTGDRPPENGDRPRAVPGYLPGAVLVSRPAWEAVGPFRTDVRVGELLDWLLRARELGRRELVVADHVLWRRIHGDNQTIVERASFGEYAQILKRALDRRRWSAR